MKIPDGDRQSGFTLLETLIAFLILSIALGIATQSISAAALAYRKADALRAADRLVSEVLAEYGGIPGSPKQENGVAADGKAWTLTRETIPLGDANLTTARINVDVYDKPDGRLIRSYLTFEQVGEE